MGSMRKEEKGRGGVEKMAPGAKVGGRARIGPDGRLGAVGPKEPTSEHRARFMSLFLIWRLHQQPRYAYSLISEINGMAMSPCRTSTLYAMLDRLEKQGHVKSHEETAGNRLRRLYQTTPAGWKLFSDIKKTRFKGLLQEFMKALVS